jgi:hypothetical protein
MTGIDPLLVLDRNRCRRRGGALEVSHLGHRIASDGVAAVAYPGDCTGLREEPNLAGTLWPEAPGSTIATDLVALRAWLARALPSIPDRDKLACGECGGCGTVTHTCDCGHEHDHPCGACSQTGEAMDTEARRLLHPQVTVHGVLVDGRALLRALCALPGRAATWQVTRRGAVAFVLLVSEDWRYLLMEDASGAASIGTWPECTEDVCARGAEESPPAPSIDPMAILDPARCEAGGGPNHFATHGHLVWSDSVALVAWPSDCSGVESRSWTDDVLWPECPTPAIPLDLVALRAWLTRVMPPAQSAATRVKCSRCDGSGRWCGEECEECGGAGKVLPDDAEAEPVADVVILGGRFNGRFLLRALSALPGDSATWQRTGPEWSSPALIVGEGWRYVLMPVRSDTEVLGTWTEVVS